MAIAAVAAAIEHFERSCVFAGQSEIRLGKALSQMRDSSSFRAVGITTSVRNYILENVLLDADTVLLVSGESVILDTAYFVPEDKWTGLKIDPNTLIHLNADEDIVIGYNNTHLGYQHWLTQCLPAIDWSLRRQRTRSPRLLLPRLEAWQEDFMRILGHHVVPRLTPQAGTQYFLPSAEFSEFLNGSTSFGISLATLATARRVLDALPSFPSPHAVIYVPCASPYYGSIGNEVEVVDVLQRRGIHVVDRGRLSTADRINLFRHADVIIGPLGQGLADILFCKPGALLWEWMPEHHQNASFNRLAQAAEVDYWGDLFASSADGGSAVEWRIDMATVSLRLAELSNRFALRSAGIDTSQMPARGEAAAAPIAPIATSMPIDELMNAFESLGDNCEFGLVQRLGGAEPLGLLRFAGIFLPIEIRLEKLASALERKFEGLGAEKTVTVYLAGEPGRREFLVRESVYDLLYHTGVGEGEIDPEEMLEREIKRLTFLRRKLLEDLQAGDKIWVWKSAATPNAEQVRPLLNVLRSLGPNTLLWVVEGDEKRRPGTIEYLDEDFIKGYVERFAPYDNATDVWPASWFAMCHRAFHSRYPNRIAEPQQAPAVKPQRILSAIELLASHPASVSTIPDQDGTAASKKPRSWLGRLFGLR